MPQTGALVEIRGVPAAQQLIWSVGKRAMAPQPFLRVAGGIVKAGFERQMDSDGKAYGSGWQPLAEATLRRKAEEGYPSRIMERTGELKRRVGSIENMATFSIREGMGNYFVGRFKQTGTKHEPRRQLLGVSAADRGKIYAIAYRYLAEGLL